MIPIAVFVLFIFSTTTTQVQCSVPFNKGTILHVRHDAKRNQHQSTMLSRFKIASISGAISCSVTHSLVVPLDVVKTKMQTDSTMASKSIWQVGADIFRSGGSQSLLSGLMATFTGYFLQGFCKFGFYDAFKTLAFEKIKDPAAIVAWRLPVLIASSGLAECLASFVLTPLEAARISMVLSPHGGLLQTLREIVQQGGVLGLYRGLPLILLRQVPYTCAKLVGYEIVSENIKQLLSSHQTTDQSCAKNSMKMHAGVHILSGVIAGCLAAAVSQPADVLLSRLCGGTHALTECLIIDGPSSLMSAVQQLGWKGCFTGLQPRAVMIASLTSLQFLLYEQSKSVVASYILQGR
jgi:solute carrier family 25 phosphate transporter 3